MSFYQDEIDSVVTGHKHGVRNPCKQTTQQLHERYSNSRLMPYIGTQLEAVVTGITVNPLIGSYIVLDVYTNEGVVKAYDLLDCPGVEDSVNEERKRRYMTILGSRNKTVGKALKNPYSLSASLGTQWGHNIKHKGFLLELTVQPYVAETTCNVYFAVLAAHIVDKDGNKIR